LLLTEGAKENAIDAVQFLISSAVEYGIDVPTLGAGAPLGSAAETVIDAVFAIQSVTSTIDSFKKIVNDAGKFKDIFNESMALKSKINGDLPGFYAAVKKIVQKVLNHLGNGAKSKVKDLSAELKSVVKKMADQTSDAIGKAVKFLIPDAAIGAAVSQSLEQIVQDLSKNCFDVIERSLKKAGKLSKFVLDPEALPKFIEDTIPKLITFLRDSAKKIQDASIMKAMSMGGGAGLILKQLGPVGLKKLAGILDDKKQDVIDLAKKISGILIPITFLILAIAQILLRDEFMVEHKKVKKNILKESTTFALLSELGLLSDSNRRRQFC
jgi:hypothetical protein